MRRTRGRPDTSDLKVELPRPVLRDVLFLADVVPALVLAQVHVLAPHQGADELLGEALVPRLGGAHEVVEADVEAGGRLAEGGRVAVRPRLGGEVVLLRGRDHLVGVLVRAREQEGVLAAQPVQPRHRIGDHGGVDVPEVGALVHVVDRCGEVEAVAVRHRAAW